MHKIAEDYKVQLFDFHNSSEFMDKKYFRDYEHLNNVGALKFSSMLKEKLKVEFRVFLKLRG